MNPLARYTILSSTDNKMVFDNSLVFGIANLENRFGIVSGWHHLLSIFNYEIF